MRACPAPNAPRAATLTRVSRLTMLLRSATPAAGAAARRPSSLACPAVSAAGVAAAAVLRASAAAVALQRPLSVTAAAAAEEDGNHRAPGHGQRPEAASPQPAQPSSSLEGEPVTWAVVACPALAASASRSYTDTSHDRSAQASTSGRLDSVVASANERPGASRPQRVLDLILQRLRIGSATFRLITPRCVSCAAN
jgi:hypothetical protein